MGLGGGPLATPPPPKNKTPFLHPKNIFRKVKTLGEDDPWLDDAAAWIERSRKLQQEKELAEKRVRGGQGGRFGVGPPPKIGLVGLKWA